MSNSKGQAIIALIEKTRQEVSQKLETNSLMSVNTKIRSKVIALRIKKLIKSLVHCDQTANVSN